MGKEWKFVQGEMYILPFPGHNYCVFSLIVLSPSHIIIIIIITFNLMCMIDSVFRLLHLLLHSFRFEI